MVLPNLLFFSVIILIQACESIPQLHLTFYYETKSPKSKAFVLYQLQPAVELLHKYINLKVVSFGNSKRINEEEFLCPRGSEECLGNKIHTCALNALSDDNALMKTKYLVCEMMTMAGVSGSFHCSRESNIPIGIVTECLDKYITALQKEAEFLTKFASVKTVPTLIVDGRFKIDIKKNSQEDLIGVLCGWLRETSECAHYHNMMALSDILQG